MNDDYGIRISRIKFAVYTTVFGVLWGILEMTAGTWLQMLNVPFRGALLAGAGSVVLCAGRVFSPVYGSCLVMGVLAAAVKTISYSAFKLGPVSGILIEAALAEVILSAAGLSRVSVFLACLVNSLEGVPHFFVSNWIVYGGDIFSSYMRAVEKIQLMLGLSGGFWVKVLALWAAGHIAIGAASGAVAVYAVERLKHEI